MNGDKSKGRARKSDRTSDRLRYSLDYLFDYYYQAKKSEGRAVNTLKTYEQNYASFCEFLDMRKIVRDIRNVTVETGREYIIWLRDEKTRFSDNCNVPDSVRTVGLLPKAINTRVKNLKTMFKFLHEEDVIDSDPFTYLKNVQDIGREIDVLAADELRALLNAPNQRKYSDFRDYVVLNLLIDGMLRIDEALTLRKEDVDLTACYASLRREVTKTRKPRVVPITKRTAKLIAELIRETTEFDSEHIFLTNYGERMQPNHFRHQLKKYADRAGIEKRVYPHLLRHSGATLFLEEGGSERHLQVILGHADGRMTNHYTHLSDKNVKKNHDEFSPINAVIGKSERPRKIIR
ncbi:integrase [Paenibacillus odorifer]|uniref:tyrosine-type recombinase/integrase n=1 Tax=Paenibacillus TaxID=44249 RepID=UPI0003E20C72|nr:MULTISPECIES: tyrosine-type recombinase/integrase [Paenibacillus]ETT64882.1 site-specific integrase [Paenibacillus sp. FSL H8-237]OME61001.1 integrase [Paenibacillus odorifer]